MKKFLLFLLIFNSLNSFGQVDPDLFKTWHLYSMQESDLGTPYEIDEIQPTIRPFITILETTDPDMFEMNGEGACNTFSGTYNHTYIPTYPEFTAIDFTSTQDDCGIQIHNQYETSFFGFIEYAGWYAISQDGQGLKLVISNPIFGYVLFKDYPLSVSENNTIAFKIFPNPVSEELFIISEKTLIDKIVVYSITGEKILEKDTIENAIDVSFLSKGMYFLEITSEEGKSVQKFIKK